MVFRRFVMLSLLWCVSFNYSLEAKKLSLGTRIVGLCTPVAAAGAFYGACSLIVNGDKVVRAVWPRVRDIAVPTMKWVADLMRKYPRGSAAFVLGCGAAISARHIFVPWMLMGIDVGQVLWTGDTSHIVQKKNALKKQRTIMAKLFGDILRVRESLLLKVAPECQHSLHVKVFTDLKQLYRKRYKRSKIKAVSIDEMLLKKNKKEKYGTLGVLKDSKLAHCWSPLVTAMSVSVYAYLGDENMIVNYGGMRLIEALQKLVTAAEEIKAPGTNGSTVTANTPIITISQTNNNSPLKKKKNPALKHLKEFARQARVVRDILTPLFENFNAALDRLETVLVWL